MKAKDIMSIHTITVAPEATVQDVARKLLEHQVSALPVVDQHGKVLGIVSEGDLMRRTEAQTEKHRSWWLRQFADPTVLSQEYVKAHARHARDVMTKEIVTVTPETPVSEIAEVLEKRRIKRVPVLADGKLVGIVSRANLLHALVSMRGSMVPATQSDDAIRRRILDGLEQEPWASRTMTNVVVKDGIVELWGGVSSEEEKQAGRVLAENVPGVKKVNDGRFVMPLRWAYD